MQQPRMHGSYLYNLLLSLFIYNVHSLTLQNDATIMPSSDVQYPPLERDECDPSSIPVLQDFDLQRFSGSWYELAKSESGYIDVNDGMWKIQTTNTSTMFLFSGRNNNAHCIRPIKGKMYTDQPPGTLNLHYKTYSNHVEETIRVLFTDYATVAVIYKCVHHVHREKEMCHPAGFVGAIWTRQPHVQLHVYESAVRYLEMACVHKSVLKYRNLVGPCEVDDIIFGIDDFPVPDFCYQPLDLGSCKGNLHRYYFNSKTKKCETFTFYGCGGNDNNFLFLQDCQKKCLSVSPQEKVCLSVAKCAIHCAPCCSEDRSGCVECNCEQIMEGDTQPCEKSPAHCQPECEIGEFYPGCYVCNHCKDVLPIDVIDKPACLEEKYSGNCENNIKRYFYNAITGECEQFIYSGCNGNKNNFETMKECQEACIVLKAEEVDPDSASDIKYNLWIMGTLLLMYITACQLST